MPRNLLNYEAFYKLKADRTGLEPATSAVTGRHSNQLNYRSKRTLETTLGVTLFRFGVQI